MWRVLTAILTGSWMIGGIAIVPQESSADELQAIEAQSLLTSYCIDCHGGESPESGLNIVELMSSELPANRQAWEQIVRRLSARQMPPIEAARPTEPEYQKLLSALCQTLDQEALDHPRPGRTETFRRLTRFEYQQAIRDLLNLELDVTRLLPADEVSHGFDNVTVGELSPTLLNRYIAAAQKISRLAMGRLLSSPDGTTVRVRPDVTQEEHVEGLPLGTRGGVVVPYTFPQDGEYEVRVRLARDRDERVEGLHEPHELEMLLDLERIELFTVHSPHKGSPVDEYGGSVTHETVDRHLVSRVKVAAGAHDVGVAFLKNPTSLLETKRQPLNVHYNMYRHPRIGPAVFQVSIAGPFAPRGVGDTPSRRRILGRILAYRPSASGGELAQLEKDEDSARQVIGRLLRRACRQPIEDDDVTRALTLYRETRAAGKSFDDGIEIALAAILVNPRFLFRIEHDPAGAAPGMAYRVSDIELASRLSFFLWSSIPDEELLELAERSRLSHPRVLEQQTRRMLADDRARALVSNFAGQWLYLRNLDSITPDARLYPDFDDNLRQAFRTETELFFQSVIDEDRSVLDLLQADYTYLNERLAKHYGIPHIYGSRFRRVELDASTKRGGLLRQGSILSVTSYATRTSPVIRGKWILENVLGLTPPPPPPNIPALAENTISAELTVRERLAQHRADPACASCHRLLDPIGFALENYDALGKWRDMELGQPVDAGGSLLDGKEFVGPAGLEQGLLERPEGFVGTLVEKLLTYALGRGCEPDDAPAIRQIVREAQEQDYRFSSLIHGIVSSTPFQMRMSK